MENKFRKKKQLRGGCLGKQHFETKQLIHRNID